MNKKQILRICGAILIGLGFVTTMYNWSLFISMFGLVIVAVGLGVVLESLSYKGVKDE